MIAARAGLLLLDQLSAQPLMNPFSMVVGHEFPDDVAEMSLAQKDEVSQTFVFDGFDKALRMRVAVRVPSRNPHASHPSPSQNCLDPLRKR
jgi:hypothetical protein